VPGLPYLPFARQEWDEAPVPGLPYLPFARQEWDEAPVPGLPYLPFYQPDMAGKKANKASLAR